MFLGGVLVLTHWPYVFGGVLVLTLWPYVFGAVLVLTVSVSCLGGHPAFWEGRSMCSICREVGKGWQVMCPEPSHLHIEVTHIDLEACSGSI